jgi:hypothetical protein
MDTQVIEKIEEKDSLEYFLDKLEECDTQDEEYPEFDDYAN